MASLNTAYVIIKQHEGGYANAKNDKGGETYAGISRNYNPSWEGWPYIDFKKKTTFLNKTIPNNAIFSQIQYAVDSFYESLWNKNKLSEIKDQNIANLLFDYIVNSGSIGVKAIQKIVGVKDDGVIGKETIKAINNSNNITTYNKLLKQREQHYKKLIANDPSQKDFEDSWTNRIKSFATTSPNSTTIFILIIGIIIYKFS